MTQEVKYNDIHTTGMGYLNRARTVNPSQGDPYEAVSLTGLVGKIASPRYTYYDCKSVIGKALDKYLLLKDAINDKDKKVLVRFKVSDNEPDSYVTKDRKTGQDVRRHIIKCRLLAITWASIDGQVVEFQLDDDDQQSPDPVEGTVQSITFGDGEAMKVRDADHPDPNSSDKLPELVKLDKSDPDFLIKKDALKSKGYLWDSSQSGWFLPATQSV